MLASLLDTLATSRADEHPIAIDGAPVTGARIARMARAHARRLQALGVVAGDRVAVCAPTSLELIAALLAHLRLGVVHVPINTRYRPPEVAHVLGDSGARASFALGGASAADPDARELAGLADDDMDDDDDAPLAWPPARPASPAAIIYTSGTTGRAKGVVLSQRALAANLGAMMALWGIGPRDVVSHPLPIFHVHGLGLGLLGPLLAGARVRLSTRLSPADVVADFAADDGATVFMGVPTMYHALVEHLEGRLEDAAPLSRGRLFTAGSAALPTALLERFLALTGHRILERYGMTETLFTLSNPLAGERRAGTVGLPVPGAEVRVVGDDGAPIAPGEAGEIEVRGEHLMDGYWQDPAATAAAYRDGWFRTGDIATIDPDGYHRIVGRRSTDIIKSGGFKIGAREIEDVLLAHPAVAEVAVVGLPDARWGEIVAAAVVVSEASLADEDARAALDAFCREHLADYKRPRRFLIATALPRNAMGKVVKPEVRRLFE